MAYSRCRTCGRYIPAGAGHCSGQCAQRFRACETCGGYYADGDGYSERYCSRQCSVQYKTIPAGGLRPVGTFAEATL